MLQKYRKCKIKYLLKPPFTPVYDPPPPAPCICSSSSPCTSQWECFASNQCFNTFFRLHKKDIPAKNTSKAQKMQKSGTYKSPFLPPYFPPWSPYPRSNFFVSKQSLDIYLESILMNYLPRMLQMLKKIRYFYSLFSENLRLAQNLPNEVFLTISDFKVDIPHTEILRISLAIAIRTVNKTADVSREN